MQLQTSKTPNVAVSIWISLCLAVFASIMMLDYAANFMGGGVAITKWKPLETVTFPVDDAQFEAIFEDYRKLPQFTKTFPEMDVYGFKTIYLVDYARYILEYLLVGLYLIPLLCFYCFKRVSVLNVAAFTAIFLWGSVRNFLDLYMSTASLYAEPYFVPYGLSIQTGMQFVFFALMLWQLLSFTYPKQGIGGFELPKPSWFMKVFACIVLAGISLQIVLGGAKTGLHAVLTFNTVPVMDNNSLLPEGLWPMTQWYRNLFEDATTAQFVHKLIAGGLFGLITLFWIVGRNNPHVAHLLAILFSIFVVEVLLGTLTLLFAEPTSISLLHYADAILVFGIAVSVVHRLFIPIKSISYDF
ncbi:MAG TPA: COX15/CtaA family protein [Rickettsiales bacterium]|nr:COX15/CtaA family protein [Rickettsiales bacterium]